MKYFLFIGSFAAMVLFASACSKTQQTKTADSTSTQQKEAAESNGPITKPLGEPQETVIGDVRIINYTNGGGRRPKENEIAIVYVQNWVGDSLLADSRQKFGGPLTVPMKPITDPSQGALHYALLHMGIGDSVTVFRPIDKGIRKNLPPRLQNETLMRANMVLVDAKDPKDIPDAQQQMSPGNMPYAPANQQQKQPAQKKQ